MGLRERNAMKLHLYVALALAAAAISAQSEEKPPQPPTWQDMLAAGIVPYRQLTVDDFAVKDAPDAKHAFYIKTAVEPRYEFLLKPHTNGFAYAYIQRWLVFAGLNKKETWRQSKFKTMKAELPYAQALLDINEIHSRRLAALKPGELPSGRGASFDEAQGDLEGKLKQLVEATYRTSEAEMAAFAKATNNGENKKKVRELAADIRKRLDATPATTVPYPDAAAATSESPRESAAATAMITPSPSPAAASPAASRPR